MNGFAAALWAEQLKARRSKVLLLSLLAFAILPLVDGLFMLILKDPAQARSMGLISAKAQLTAGTADWPNFFQVLLMGTAVGGAILFAFLPTWVFGREFADHTVKELLALPARREASVGAKFVLIAVWMLLITLLIFLLGLAIGALCRIPGWSGALAWSSLATLLLIVCLTYLLMPFVALMASLGRGYLPALAWAILTLAMAQIAVVMGWGDWFPWSVPALLVAFGETAVEPLAPHSLVVVLLAFAAGTTATFVWWRSADQTS